MEATFPWNLTLFHLINASAAPNGAIVLMAKGLAVFTPWIAVGILLLYWFRRTPEIRRSLMIAGVALGFALAVNFSLASAMYEPRPFVLGIGNTLLVHGPETSFPSDHATFLWSLGFGLLMSRSLPVLGIFVCVLGGATAWARVYLGVHFPLDMAASFIISLIAAVLARALAGKLEGVLFQPVERLNGALMKTASDLLKRRP